MKHRPIRASIGTALRSPVQRLWLRGVALVAAPLLVRPVLLGVAAAAPLALVAAPAVAQTTHWHGWTYVESAGNTTFNKLVVSFAGTGGNVTNRSVANSSIAGVAIANAPTNGYTLTWPANTPFKPGETVSAQFTTNFANIALAGASAYNGAALVGTIDANGVLVAANGNKLGQLCPALAKKAGVAEQAIIDRVDNWAAKLAAGGPIAAHAAAMADLYTLDATLLPTLGSYNLYRNLPYNAANPDAPIIENYFRHVFLPLKPTMQPLNLGAVHVVVAGDLGSANGLYTFKKNAPGCAGKFTHARFTFVFRKENDVWTIVQHHSSQNPGGGAAGGGGCPADIDGDGKVDGADLGLLLAEWGEDTAVCLDLSGDGMIDGADLGLLLAAWGSCN